MTLRWAPGGSLLLETPTLSQRPVPPGWASRDGTHRHFYRNHCARRSLPSSPFQRESSPQRLCTVALPSGGCPTPRPPTLLASGSVKRLKGSMHLGSEPRCSRQTLGDPVSVGIRHSVVA